MTQPDRDDEFEDFLKRRTVLPAHTPVDEDLQPPRSLDAIVLRQAREAVQARRRSNTTRRWAIPVALAATILLCLSVVLNVSLRTNRPQSYSARVTTDLPANAPGAAEPPAIPAPRSEASSSGSLAARPSPPADSGVEEIVVAPTPAPRAPAGAAAPQLADPQGGVSQAPAAPAPAQAASKPEPRAAAEAERREQVADAAAPEAQARQDEEALRQNVTVTGMRATQKPPLAKALKRESDVSAVGPHPDDPKVWLAQIDALRTAGRTSEADAEMRRFRIIFPNYPIKPTDPVAPEPPK